jgi:hypothetical protein
MELYPASAHDAFHGVGLQYPHHIDEAVTQIHGACKGLGTDEQTLIAVLGSKSPETRNLIALRFKELHRQPLKSLLKSETSGDFGRLLRMISTPLPETEAQLLRDATKGMGTTESLIVQILSGRSNDEMSILKRTYFDLVGKDLAVTLNSELSGDFRKVVMAVLQSPQVPYNPAVHNAAKAEEEAIALYKAGQGRLGTNEEVFIDILVKAPPEFLKMMDAVYVAKYNNNIAKAVDREFSGDAKKSLNYLVRSVMDPYPAIAEVFEKTMKGFGTDETGLSTALVRYQSLLPRVKAAYKKQYHEELRDRISGETSGDYKKLLLEVFDAPQDPPRSKVKGANGAASYTAASAATAGASSPAYLSTQTSYAASTSSLHASQGHGAAQPYPTSGGQQAYGQPPQAAPGQAAYGAVPHQPPTSQPGGYPPQTPTSQPPSGYAPSGNSYPGQSPNQSAGSQAPGYPPQQQQPGYPTPQGYPQAGQQAYGQAAPGQAAYGAVPPTSQPAGYPPQTPTSQPPSGYAPSGNSYPGQSPNQSAGSQAPGYPPQQQQQPGYPAQQYPPTQAPGYPPQQQQQAGYPTPQYPPSGQQPQYSAPGQQPFQQQYPPPGQPYQQYGAAPYGAAPPPHGSYPPPGHQPQYPNSGGYPQYPPPGQQPQQYPPPGQPYQQYGAAPYGAAPPPHGSYPPPGHQPQYPNPSGYPPYRGM